MKHNATQWKITALMPLMVFFLFALCLLTVLLTGAKVYRQTVSQGQALSDSRTAIRYLTTRVRQADSAGQIALDRFDDADALVFYEEIDGELYKTLVYCHKGYLRELFCSDAGMFSAEDGETILPLKQLLLRDDGNCIQMQLFLPDDSSYALTLHLRSRGEALP